MNMLILASSIALAIILAFTLKKQKQRAQEAERQFWERERQANSVRRKPLDSLDYIHIPLETLPFDIMPEDSRIAEYQSLVKDLSAGCIVNLTGYSNTDLKLEYGTANITALSEYDQNYTILVRTLQKWADILLEEGYVEEARLLMEFAISTGTDISHTYYKLADIYTASGDIFQIEKLITQAEQLRSSTKDTIVRTLREAYP